MLFCLTRRRSNDGMSRAISMRFPLKQLEIESGVLQPLSKAGLDLITASLRQNGYAILGQKVPDNICDDLMQFALTQPASLRQTDEQSNLGGKAIYDPAQPQAIIYEFEKGISSPTAMSAH
jgi:hypothetical protein